LTRLQLGFLNANRPQIAVRRLPGCGRSRVTHRTEHIQCKQLSHLSVWTPNILHLAYLSSYLIASHGVPTELEADHRGVQLARFAVRLARPTARRLQVVDWRDLFRFFLVVWFWVWLGINPLPEFLLNRKVVRNGPFDRRCPDLGLFVCSHVAFSLEGLWHIQKYLFPHTPPIPVTPQGKISQSSSRDNPFHS